MPNAKKESKRKVTQRPDGPPWRVLMHDVIFESDTRAGWGFDVGLLIAILASIAIVSLGTLESYRDIAILRKFEVLLTLLFTIEYFCRLSCARHPLRYAFSFWGIIDLLSILPTYAEFFFEGSGADSLTVLRSIRLLRAFRVLKLWRMMDDAEELSQAIWKARHKIIVFLMVVMVAVTISGTLMYFIEHELPRIMLGGDQAKIDKLPISKFDSIPQSMYWAIVTMTTVGYGDIVPLTIPGKMISATLILLGYSLIIVPSGFVTAELTSPTNGETPATACPRCNSDGHLDDAVYCFRCGHRLID